MCCLCLSAGALCDCIVLRMQVLIRGFISVNERAAASAVGPDPGKQLADGRAAAAGGSSIAGAALAQQVGHRGRHSSPTLPQILPVTSHETGGSVSACCTTPMATMC